MKLLTSEGFRFLCTCVNNSLGVVLQRLLHSFQFLQIIRFGATGQYSWSAGLIGNRVQITGWRATVSNNYVVSNAFHCPAWGGMRRKIPSVTSQETCRYILLFGTFPKRVQTKMLLHVRVQKAKGAHVSVSLSILFC